MPIQIGTRSRPAEDVVDLLVECHARIRTFSALAVALAEAQHPSREEVQDAAQRVRRYFLEALPLHARDEEESIVPRLEGRDPELDRALAGMRREHAEHGPLLDAVVGICEELARAPERHAALAPALLPAARELRAHFEGHLAPEEETIFPAIRRLVPEADRARMLEELRARREPGQSSR